MAEFKIGLEDLEKLDATAAAAQSGAQNGVSNGAASSAVEDEGKRGLLEELEGIDGKYNISNSDISYPDTLGLEKMENTPLSDEDIERIAREQLISKQLSGVNSINDDADRKVNDLDDKKSAETASIASQIEELQRLYEQRKREAEKDALKRGLSRSSIIMNKIEDFDGNKIKDTEQLNSALSDALVKIDFNIASLETQRAKALSDFDISFAAELSGKIDALKNERQEKIDETLKYNNTVTEKESKYQADKDEAQRKAKQQAMENYLKIAEAQSKGNTDAINKLILDEKVGKVKEYYDKLSPQEALTDFLKDGTMSYHLKEYYDYMLQYLKIKAAR
jgi:hypothetical protein